MTETDRAVLRHMLATLAYRGGKALRDAPPGFADFTPDGVVNTPLALVAHIADLVEWTARFVAGDEESYRVTAPSTWDGEVTRFFEALSVLDALVRSDAALPAPLDRVFQAPIADALTHIGQIALLRRMAGSPVLGEAYRLAPIEAGRVGRDQGAPGKEFALNKGAVWRAPNSR